MMIGSFLLMAAAGIEALPDGRCDEYPASPAIEIGEGATLRIRETADHVGLCIAVPPGSYGVADLIVDAPALPEPLQLHASAQLGEWRPDRPEEAPTAPDSPIWGNNRGWTANVMRFDGRVPRAPLEAREFSISKARFGRGEWRLRLTMIGLARPDGSMASAQLGTPEAPLVIAVG